MTKTVSGYEYDVRTRTSMGVNLKLNEGARGALNAGLVGNIIYLPRFSQMHLGGQNAYFCAILFLLCANIF